MTPTNTCQGQTHTRLGSVTTLHSEQIHTEKARERVRCQDFLIFVVIRPLRPDLIGLFVTMSEKAAAAIVNVRTSDGVVVPIPLKAACFSILVNNMVDDASGSINEEVVTTTVMMMGMPPWVGDTST